MPVGELGQPAAVELYTDRARAVRPGFLADGQAGEVVEDICRQLDDRPLAVELAAARLRALVYASMPESLRAGAAVCGPAARYGDQTSSVMALAWWSGSRGNRLPLLRSTAVPFEKRNDITTGCPESVRVLIPLGEDVVEPLP